MCGIFGSISTSEPDQSDLLVRLKTLEHRGPDGTGSLSYFEDGKYFFFGQCSADRHLKCGPFIFRLIPRPPL